MQCVVCSTFNPAFTMAAEEPIHHVYQRMEAQFSGNATTEQAIDGRKELLLVPVPQGQAPLPGRPVFQYTPDPVPDSMLPVIKAQDCLADLSLRTTFVHAQRLMADGNHAPTHGGRRRGAETSACSDNWSKQHMNASRKQRGRGNKQPKQQSDSWNTTEQNRKSSRICCNRYSRPSTAPSSTTGRRSSYRHLLGRLHACRSLTQCVRESDCWFGAWHGATHTNPRSLSGGRITISVEQGGLNIAFRQVTRV